MFQIISIIILIFTLANANDFHKNPKLLIDGKLANIILKSSDAIEENPQRSSQCFAVYIPKLNQLTKEYESSYENCLQKAQNALSNIDLEVEKDILQIDQLGQSICSQFSSCYTNSSYEFFECYHEAAGESMKKSYVIQTTSKEQMQFINMRYQTIKNDQIKCIDDCTTLYTVESMRLYVQLEACLDGENVGETN